MKVNIKIMNPTPVAQPQPLPPPAVSPPANNFTEQVVNNIPVHAPSAAATNDADLDKIMQDVGQEIKQAERQTPKKHFLGFGHKPKPAAPVKPSVPMPIQEIAPPAPNPVAALPAVSAQPKTKPTSSFPLMIVLVTIVVTGLLMAAAYYTYKNS